MHPTKKTARVAGLLYPLMGIPAVFALICSPQSDRAGPDQSFALTCFPLCPGE